MILKKTKHDFKSLTAEIFKANVHDVGTEPTVLYCADYPQAIAQAIDQRDYADLIILLDAQEPIHPCLGPALAEAFRAQEQGKVAGAAPQLTTYTEGLMVLEMKQMRYHRQSVETMKEKISTAWGINVSTVKRVWDAIEDKPPKQYVCKLKDCDICRHFTEMPSHLK